MASLDPGRRIVVYGPSGSGKSTLTPRIASRLGLPAIQLDAIVHSRPNWDDLSDAEFRAAVTETMDGLHDGWVIEGNYSVVRDLILPHAETAIWLRLPFHIVYPRLVRRTLTRGWRHETLWGVNHESLRLAFFSRDSMLLWGITAWKRHHRTMRQALREAKGQGVRIVVLRSPAEVAAFVESLPDPIEAPPVNV